MIERFASGAYVHPAALFALTEDEVKERAETIARHDSISTGWRDDEPGEDAPGNTPSGEESNGEMSADPHESDDVQHGRDIGPWNNPEDAAPHVAAE